MDTLTVKTVPAVIDADYESYRDYLKTEIAKYDIVVTEDTVKDAKALATKLNKVKSEIADKRKAAVAAASEPVKAFEAKVKELETMCEDGRQRILSQVSAFESATLKLAESELKGFLVDCYRSQGVTEEFQTATVDDLVKLGALTGTGKLAKAARDAVIARVGECVNKQQRTALRLSQLENQSHRSGLHSPLTREHVAGILFCVDEGEYQSNLENLINRELERQKETLARADQIRQEEAAKQAPVEAQPVAQQAAPEFSNDGHDYGECPAQQAVSTAQPAQAVVEAPAVKSAPAGTFGNRQVQVCVMLVVEVPKSAPLAAVEAATRKKLVSAGVEKSIQSIYASELAQQGAA